MYNLLRKKKFIKKSGKGVKGKKKFDAFRNVIKKKETMGLKAMRSQSKRLVKIIDRRSINGPSTQQLQAFPTSK